MLKEFENLYIEEIREGQDLLKLGSQERIIYMLKEFGNLGVKCFTSTH